MSSPNDGQTASVGPQAAPLPYVVVADTPTSTPSTNDRPLIRAKLLEHGAVLLRGFGIGDVNGFEQVVRAVSGEPLTYAERSSPRSTIQGNVYTSTDYPANEEIFLHNENSYQSSWPMTLFFYCVRPPLTFGATPLAGTRQIHEAIDPDVSDEFAARGWTVVRNFHQGVGVGWQQAFDTDDPRDVARYASNHHMEIEWRHTGTLRTKARRRAVHRHPVTGELVWFNHITFFHVTTLAEEVRTGLCELFAEDDLPANTYYGDGGRIPDDVVAHLRDCYRANQRRFDWRTGDVLIVDNMLAAHGREPFTGPRKIAVAMAEPWTPTV